MPIFGSVYLALVYGERIEAGQATVEPKRSEVLTTSRAKPETHYAEGRRPSRCEPRNGSVAPTVEGHMDYTMFRKEKDNFFAGGHSPLPEDVRLAFDGLKYFEPDEALELVLTIESDDGGMVEVQTSDGATRYYTRAGAVTFVVNEEPVTLTLFSAPGDSGYFMPFRDVTSGKASYGAGRYLDLEAAVDGKVEIDFNLAYNPYCAYSEEYSCPLPPSENWLTVPITAGEKAY